VPLEDEMTYRDDREALVQRADNLEEQLAEANERLKAARQSLAVQEKKDAEDERRLAELAAQVDALRGRLGLPARVITEPKKESSTAAVVALGSMVVLGLFMAGGVLVYAITSPGAGEPQPPPSPVMPWVIGGAFVLFGLPLVGLALSTFAKDRRIAKWPRTQGTILVSRISSSTNTARDKDGYDRQYTSHTPEVSYSYAVEGTEYEGSVIARGGVSTSNRKVAVASIDRYPPGKAVDVLYDPTDPTTAYLEVRRSIGGVILLGCGGLLMGIGVLIIGLVAG
jgi:hypothetical protein